MDQVQPDLPGYSIHPGRKSYRQSEPRTDESRKRRISKDISVVFLIRIPGSKDIDFMSQSSELPGKSINGSRRS
jgi:hypothetical protein